MWCSYREPLAHLSSCRLTFKYVGWNYSASKPLKRHCQIWATLVIAALSGFHSLHLPKSTQPWRCLIYLNALPLVLMPGWIHLSTFCKCDMRWLAIVLPPIFSSLSTPLSSSSRDTPPSPLPFGFLSLFSCIFFKVIGGDRFFFCLSCNAIFLSSSRGVLSFPLCLTNHNSIPYQLVWDANPI